MIPLMALLGVISLHWGQFLALFGAGPEAAEFTLTRKAQPLPTIYVTVILVSILLFELLPYSEELFRGWRSRRRSA
jgi:hypothetical protein